jgi:MFS family permease
MNGATAAPSVFASRTFRLYFAGQGLSFIGDGLRLLSVPLLAFHLTHSALSTGTALICEVAPYSLFALVGGSLADRVDRRRLMIGCDFVRFIVMSFFAIAYVLHELTLPMIYIGLIVISICAAGFVGGQMSSIPYLLGRDQATKGNAVLIAAENTSNLITPAIGGALFATLGPLPALVINALTYLGSQISLVLIPSMGPDRVTGLPTLRHLLDDVALGFRQLWGDLGMRAQALTAFSFNVFGFGGYAILIPFLKKGFGASDQQVGIFFGISAFGAIAGASLAARYPDRWPFGRALVVAYLFDALFFLPVVLVSNIWVAAFFLGDVERDRELRAGADSRLSHARDARRHGRARDGIRTVVGARGHRAGRNSLRLGCRPSLAARRDGDLGRRLHTHRARRALHPRDPQ